MGEGGESKKVTFLDPKGGEPVSLSFESGGAATVSGFSSHGPVSPKLTDGFLPGASLNRSHDASLDLQVSERVLFTTLGVDLSKGGSAGQVFALVSISQ